MNLTGMLYGAKLLQFAGFPAAEVLGPAATEEEIKDLISRHGEILILSLIHISEPTRPY